MPTELACQGVRDETLALQFGDLVRRLRDLRGWSQDELAERCGLHRTFVGSIERGEKVATITTARKLARGLGISLSDLFRRLETDYPEVSDPSVDN